MAGYALQAPPVTAYLPLVEALARRFVSEVEGLDDLRQVGAIGLLKAARRYDPARGVPFPAYAIPVILGELRHHVRDLAWPVRVPRAERARAFAVPLEEETNAEEALDGADDRVLVAELLDGLRRSDRDIVRRYFFDDRSQAEVARELGMSQIQVSRALRAALAAMRVRLGASL
jgi:RNA polymerase sigma-B factor